MIEKGPGTDYLAEEHTIRHMREEFYMPELANRDKRETMQPRDDALARAAATVAHVRHAQPESCLSKEARTALLGKFQHIREVNGS
jgi:trimethylamine:corrinoid methyltransferase-like protein